MARSHVLKYVHCVFSTKDRTQLIRDTKSLWAYIRGIARNCKFLLAVGGTVDHVHVLLALPANKNLADVMRDIKANSSRHMRELGVRFAWQDGYAATSVSPSQFATVKKYVSNQPEHHRMRTFEDEYLALLQKAGIPFNRHQVFE